MIIWLQDKNYLSLLHLQNYILFASPKAACSTISPQNWACAHNCRKCTEPPYHWLQNHHFLPLQCHHIPIQSHLQQDHHGMGPGLYTPRDEKESRLASFEVCNKLNEIKYLFSAKHFPEPESVFMDLFGLPRSITIFWKSMSFQLHTTFLLFLKLIFYVALFGHPALMRCH